MSRTSETKVKEHLVVKVRFHGRQNLAIAVFVNSSIEASVASHFKMALNCNKERLARSLRIETRAVETSSAIFDRHVT
jgi:hypothetical protein